MLVGAQLLTEGRWDKLNRWLGGSPQYAVGAFLMLFGSNFGQLFVKHFAKHTELLLDEQIICRYIPFVIGAAIVVCKLIADGEVKKKRDVLSWGWILFGLYALINNYYIPNNNFEYESFYLIFEVFILLVFSVSKKWVQPFLRVLVCISLVHAGCTLFFYFFPNVYSTCIFCHVDYNSPPEYHLSYMSGLGTHYSQNGMWLATGAAAVFAQFRSHICSGASGNRIRLDAVEIILVIIALVLCGKRLHFLSAMVLMGVLYLATSTRDVKGKVFRLVSSAFVIGMAVFVMYSLDSSSANIVERALDTENYEDAAGRINMWSYATILWKQSPVFGSGFGSFMHCMVRDMPFLTPLDPHNTFLQLLSELGIVGLVAFVLLMIFSGAQACLLLKDFKKSGDAESVFSISYVLGMIVFITIYSFVGTPLAYAPMCSINFFFGIAILLFYGKSGRGIFAMERWVDQSLKTRFESADNNDACIQLSTNGPQEDESGCKSIYDNNHANGSIRFGQVLLAISTLIVAIWIAVAATGGFGSFAFYPKGGLGEYSWAELAYISGLIRDADSDEEAEAIAKDFNLVSENGTIDPSNIKYSVRADGSELEVRILGFRHDKVFDGDSVSGVTFCYIEPERKMAINTSANNNGGWASSHLYANLTGNYLELYTSKFTNDYILSASVSANNVGQTSDSSAVWAIPEKIWPLSVSEVYGVSAKNGGGNYDILKLEGDQYQLFSENNPASVFDGKSVWLRTPATFNGSDFAYVSESGDLAYAPADTTMSAAFAFCL